MNIFGELADRYRAEKTRKDRKPYLGRSAYFSLATSKYRQSGGTKESNEFKDGWIADASGNRCSPSASVPRTRRAKRLSPRTTATIVQTAPDRSAALDCSRLLRLLRAAPAAPTAPAARLPGCSDTPQATPTVSCCSTAPAAGLPDCPDCSDCSGCSDCPAVPPAPAAPDCSDCSGCSGCSGCSDCSAARLLRLLRLPDYPGCLGCSRLLRLLRLLLTAPAAPTAPISPNCAIRRTSRYQPIPERWLETLACLWCLASRISTRSSMWPLRSRRRLP